MKLVSLLSIPNDKTCADWVKPTRFDLRASDLNSVRQAAKFLAVHKIHLVPLFSPELMEELCGKDFVAKSEQSYLYLATISNGK